MKLLLVSYDNESFTNWFPLNLGYLAAIAEKHGHFVEIYDQDIHHWPHERLTWFLDNNRFDFVGVGIVAGYFPYRQLLKIAKAINESVQRPMFLIGGHGVTPEPEYFLRKTGADICVLGEAEETIRDLLSGKTLGKDIPGIACLDRSSLPGTLMTTGRREPVQDLDSLPMPAYDLFDMNVYRMGRDPHAKPTDFLASMITGRGCTHACSFCYRMEKGLRLRSVEAVLDEIEFLQKTYGITYVRFCDELTMCSERRMAELCSRILEREMKFSWNCNGRLNYATPHILKLMKQAGCVFINYGIEAIDDDVLEKMNKKLTVEQITRGIEQTLAAGISPGFNMLWGNPGDTEETLEKAVAFLRKYDDHGQLRTIRPVTPYPGSPLYYRAIESGLLEGPEDFYERKHVNSELLSVNFTDIPDDEFHRLLYVANETLIQRYYKAAGQEVVEAAWQVYFAKNASFRGFRQK